MGRNKSERLEGLLVQKDQDIASLEDQVQAYRARTSILQSRLLSTLDTLDVIQSGQNNELNAMAQTNRRIKDKLDRYSMIVKTAELERDDMRDAVLKLVEKVELSNDYSIWPHSQIRLSSLAGSPIFPSPVIQTPEPELLLHATSIIDTLRRERDLERKVHAQTRDLAQARIVSLAAQLSRREAELESFISGTAHTVSTTTTQHEHLRHSEEPIDDPLTSEQVISVLDATLARNKTLEIEIRGLFKRLEDARLTASASSSDLDRQPPAQRREMQRPLKPITSVIPSQNTAFEKVQSTSSVLDRPTVREVLSDRDYQAVQDFECQIKTLGEEIDAFAQARKSITQALRTDEEDAYSSIEARLDLLQTENHRLRLSERQLLDELDAVRISAQNRETELLDEIRCLKSSQQSMPEEANSNYHLLEPDNGEMSMELATPLLPTSVMLDLNSLHVGSLPSPYLDPPSIPLPPSPDNYSISSSLSSSRMLLHNNMHHDERPDSAVNEVERLAKAFHPP